LYDGAALPEVWQLKIILTRYRRSPNAAKTESRNMALHFGFSATYFRYCIIHIQRCLPVWTYGIPNNVTTTTTTTTTTTFKIQIQMSAVKLLLVMVPEISAPSP